MIFILYLARFFVTAALVLLFGIGAVASLVAARLAGLQKFFTSEIERRRFA